MSCLCCWASDAASSALSSLLGAGLGGIHWGLSPRAKRLAPPADTRPLTLLGKWRHLKIAGCLWWSGHWAIQAPREASLSEVGLSSQGTAVSPQSCQRLPGFPSSLCTPAPVPDSPNSKHTPLPSLFSSLKNRRVLLKVKVCTHVHVHECTQAHMHTHPDAPRWAGGEGTKGEGRTEEESALDGQRNAVSCKRQEANYQCLKRVSIYFSPLTRNLVGRM